MHVVVDIVFVGENKVYVREDGQMVAKRCLHMQLEDVLPGSRGTKISNAHISLSLLPPPPPPLSHTRTYMSMHSDTEPVRHSRVCIYT